jgi:FlaG/FlaF family flagellin (archaellin)
MPAAPVLDVLDSGARSPRHRRLVVAVAVVLAVAVAVGLLTRQRLADRVVLAASLEVATTATSPPGGAVRWSVAVRNDGARPVRVTSLATSADGIVLSSRATPGDPVGPGQQVDVPVSIRLTCGSGSAARPAGLVTAVRIRTPDGRAATRRVPLGSAGSLLDVVDTLCSVRPELRGQELSGPVVPGQG